MDKIFSKADLEILDKEFIDITDKRIAEFDITTVHGSIRLRKGEFITPDQVLKLKKEVSTLKFPNK